MSKSSNFPKTVADLFAHLDASLYEFGRYSYFDKGPHEVVSDLGAIENYLLTLSFNEVLSYFKEFKESSIGNRERVFLFEHMIESFLERDEVDDWTRKQINQLESLMI